MSVWTLAVKWLAAHAGGEAGGEPGGEIAVNLGEPWEWFGVRRGVGGLTPSPSPVDGRDATRPDGTLAGVGNRPLWARSTALCAVAVLLLAGCVKVDGDLEIDTGTVSGTVLVAVSSSWSVANGQDPTTLTDALAEELAAAPDAGVTGEPYDDGEFVGLTMRLDDVPIDRTGAATSGAVTITRRSGDYVVTGDFSELDPSTDGELAGDVPWSVHLSVTFPGAVREHDGSLRGRTVTWDLEPGRTSLHARASTGTAATVAERLPLALLVLLGLTGVAAALTWRLGARQRRADEAAGRPVGPRARRDAAREGPASGVAGLMPPRPDD